MKSRNRTKSVFSLAIVILLVILAIRSDSLLSKKQGEGEDKSTQVGLTTVNNNEDTGEEVTESETGPIDLGYVQVGDVTFKSGYTAEATDYTATPGEEVASEYAIMINAATGEIVAQKNSKTVISPASMTKILTILVAAEHIENLDEMITITHADTDFCFVNDCSNAGLMEGDQISARDLFYGVILPSGADAALALSNHVAGSQEAFVQMMNDKVEELGLSETAHFANCMGIYDENNHCTVYDMAMIMKAALENDFCREVLGAHVHTIDPSENHPEGIVLSNWFLRRIEDHMENGGVVMGAKTGYVVESGSCAASYEISATGVPYICVTGKSYSGWGAIYDHVAMYKNYGE